MDKFRLNNTEIVVAVSDNNIIGKDNKLIWHIKEDLQLFKNITNGHNIVMGRKTFESLPFILPNRHHIVLTTNKKYKVNDDRVTVVYSKEELINLITNTPEEIFYIIGGGQIYKMFFDLVPVLNISRVHKVVDGDTTFPIIDNSWEVNYEHKYDEFTYYKYTKKS